MTNLATPATKRLKSDKAAQGDLADTAVLSTVSTDGFDAICYTGGHGPLWDLSQDADSIKLIETFAASARPIGTVCHATAGCFKVKKQIPRILHEAELS